MARRTKEEAEKTRQQLLLAGLKLFSAKGFAETTVEEVAKEAGLSKGAVYWHFASKAALLRGILENRRETFLAQVDKCDFDGTTGESFLDGMACWAADIVGTEEHRQFFALMSAKVNWGDREVRPVREWMLREEFGPSYVIRHVLASLAKRGLIPADYDEARSLDLFLAQWHGLLWGRMVGALKVGFKDSVRIGLGAILTCIENGQVRKGKNK